MSDLFGNHIVCFPTRWLISFIVVLLWGESIYRIHNFGFIDHMLPVILNSQGANGENMETLSMMYMQ